MQCRNRPLAAALAAASSFPALSTVPHDVTVLRSKPASGRPFLRSLLFSIGAVLVFSTVRAEAQALPEYLLHFHGNTHEGSPLPCTGNGAVDVDVCGGPFLTESAGLDAAPAARFEFNPLIDTVARSPVDSHWTWKPAAPATVRGAVVVNFWASCNATCVALAAEWAVSVWKNNEQVAPAPTADPDDTDPTFIIIAAPSAPDVPELLSGYFVIDTPIELNGTSDTLTIKLEHNFLDAGQGSRIYYDSQSFCPGAIPGEPCDSTTVLNAADVDADGVPDALDECLGTPPGTIVEPNGCPPAAGSCAAAASAATLAALPAVGPTNVDLPVQVDWARLAPTAHYGAIVHFYRQGTRQQQNAALRRAGLTKVHDFRRYTSAVYVEGSVDAFKRLAAHPWIMRIEHNAPMRLFDATQSWTTRIRMAQERVAEGPYKDKSGAILAGKGVTLGIIDGGLFGAHPDFSGRITHNFKIVNPLITGGVPQYVDVGEGDSENVAGGHGTHVTGIVAGGGEMSDGGYPNADVAPWAPGTFTSASPQSNIIHWAHGAGILIISANVAYQHMLDNLGTEGFKALRAVNNSYGETTPGTPYNPNDAGKQMIKQIVGCNINMVFAAGNDAGDGSTDQTSSYCKDPTPGVICVASYNDQGTGALDAPLSSFSSRGKIGNPHEYPDIAAPGDLSTSACAQATATQAICTGGDDQAAETEWQPWYGTISGTSMASPNITGVIGALAQAKPELTPAEIEQLLQRTARKIGSGYEADPQLDGSTIHFGYGAGLVDMQRALDELALDPAVGITKAGLMPTDTEWTVFDGDAEPDVTEGAANAVKLTMQNFNEGGPGILYRLTVGDAADFFSPALTYRLEQNVRGVPTRTTIVATPDGVAAAEAGPSNTAIATLVERAGNVISFFVPYSQLGYPPINEPVHNVRVIVSNEAGVALDYAPSPAGGTVQTAAVQPMFGRAFTTRLAPGIVPPSNERACELPGLTRVTSGAGTTGDSSNTGHDDLRRIWVAEPGDMPGKVVITMKVDNLNPAPIANYRWYVYFNAPARTDVEAQFAAMDTVVPGSSAAPRFIRGYRSTQAAPGTAGVGIFTVEGDLPGSSFNTDGTITLVLDKAQFGLVTGHAITGIAGSIRQTSNPTNGAGLTVDSASALEPYVLVGNLPCPTNVLNAVLEASVTSGAAPLTVTFDASDSTATGTTIASYTFDFGDGSGPVTQSEPTIEYTYVRDGTYTARLTVRNADGDANTNLAEQVIAVGVDKVANAAGNNRLGGAMSCFALALLGLLGLARRRRVGNGIVTRRVGRA
jgi:serine protease AprX